MAGDDTTESFWDLLAEIARLQAEMAKNLAARAEANAATARAFQGNAETLQQMAALGRRTEQFMLRGPSAAARRAMQFFTDPMQATSTRPGGAIDPIARFFDAWRAAAEPRDSEK